MTPGIVLAAGAGTRFGEPKAPVEVNGERLVDRSVRILREAGCDPVFVLLGAWQGEVANCLVIVNHGWEEGMASSLRIGLKWARATTDADSAIVTLVDLPGLTPEAVKRIIEAPPGIAIASYQGDRGHPVRIPREHWEEIISTVSGDSGARDFFHGRDDVVFVEVADIADGTDLDLPPSA